MSENQASKLAAALADSAFDAFFATAPATMGYLHGLHESGGERFLTLAVHSSGEVRLLAPALTETQARRAGIKDVRTWRDGEDPLALLEQLATDWNLRSGILAVDDEMPAQMLLKMQATLPAALFKAGGSLMFSLMRRKSELELDVMRRAGAIADEAFEEVRPKIHAGLTELELDKMLRDAMQSRGGKPEFCIVAAGAGGAEPHHLSDEAVIQDGDVVVLDFGCDVGGYKSDITRTVAVGTPDPEAVTVYSIVYKAHMAAREAAKLGATGQDVDRAARKVIEDSGYGQWFFHRLGHGIGLRIHEEPNMVEGNDQLLEVGNTFSVEPGIYLPGRFGVRIENIVVMTDAGAKSLNAEPSPSLIHL